MIAVRKAAERGASRMDWLESYQQLGFSREAKLNKLLLVAANVQRDDLIRVYQDAQLYVSVLAGQHPVTHSLAAGRHAWIQVARGAVSVNGAALTAGDGAAISDEAKVELNGAPSGEVLLFDLA